MKNLLLEIALGLIALGWFGTLVCQAEWGQFLLKVGIATGLVESTKP